MTAIASLLLILLFSYFFTRLATIALSLTGLSRELAQLQAISAFTGVGFTTAESERIVNHPVRRRLLIALMVVGNAGIVTAVASLILSFTGVQQAQEGLTRLLWLVLGVAVLWVAVSSRWVEGVVDQAIRWALDRWTDLRAVDFSELLGLSGSYRVRELRVDPEDWLADRELGELQLFDEGVTVLGIHRADGEYVGIPRGETSVEAGDRLVLYGREDNLAELDDRLKGPSGDEAHERAKRQQAGERERQQSRQRERAAQRHLAESAATQGGGRGPGG